MHRACLPPAVLASLLLLAVGVVRADESLPPPRIDGVVQPPPPLLDAEAMSARIDQIIAAKWIEKGVTPAARATDAEFFRRLSLDINGRIPTIADLKDFCDDRRANKHRIWLERLFAKKATEDPLANDPGLYVTHFTNYWRTLLFSQTTNQQFGFGFQIDPWLRRHLTENTPYDVMVRELLTTPQGASFYQANENKPENIASNTSRLFLGVKLECAQCHDDRSGGDWTRNQFWEYAAFFANFNQGGNPRGFNQQQLPSGTGATKIKIPDKNEWVEARFLDGRQPEWKTGTPPQTILADWMTSADNPYFARAAVNRMWYYFLGTGLVDPVDVMGIVENPPSHPEILDELAYQFAAHKFDLKYLVRAITGTQAYRLTSVQSHDSQADPRLFARMAVRGLSPEQLFDSVQLATGWIDRTPNNMNRGFGFQPNTPRAQFLSKFANNKDKRTETQTSILQALFLMNSGFMADAVEKGDCLKTIAGAGAHVPTSRRIEELYIITVSRKPKPAEMERLLKYVETSNASGAEPKKAMADIFWALLNSAEFILNH